MSYWVALNFEDGVTRFIACRPEETVAEAAARAGINLFDRQAVMDEATQRPIPAHTMRPTSDGVVRIAATSETCGTGVSTHTGRIAAITKLSDSAISFSVVLDPATPLDFLPGQYADILVPGTGQKRSCSFSSSPHARAASFLIRDTPNGLLPTYLRTRAEVGTALTFEGPLGNFYLRAVKRPLLFLAGGTGLAPILSMIAALARTGDPERPIHLIYGVTHDADLVLIDQLETFAQTMPSFTCVCCVADEQSAQLRKGYVTQYLEPAHLHGGNTDVYLCGPPAMIDAVRRFMAEKGLAAANVYTEDYGAAV